ncbi:TetR/AcrR family transcriptional regulator [Streptomyces sp. NPDC004838]
MTTVDDSPRSPGRPRSIEGDPSESTRERVLRVATELFARQGYHETGVAELGEAANLRRGALYYHIGSKEALLFELSKRHVEEALTRGRLVLESPQDSAAKLRSFVHEHVAVVTARRAEVVVVLREMRHLTGTRADDLSALRRSYEHLLEQILQEGAADGRFAVVAPFQVKAILGMLNSVHLWFSSDSEAERERVSDGLADLILTGVAPQG